MMAAVLVEWMAVSWVVQKAGPMAAKLADRKAAWKVVRTAG